VNDERSGAPRLDEAARVRLGAGTESDPDALIGLATDPSVTVRAAVALNGAAPSRVNELLAKDRDERVRILLARKLTALVPGLSQIEQAQLYQETWDTLNMLVADEAMRVRALIADAVKELPNAPHALIRQLAQDTELSVYEPVIRLSPLLSTGDLLALVTKPPAAGTILAVARRASLEIAVSDAIAGTADNAAIRALLDNPLAQIRETTLDALIARSADHTDWHAPLVRRPSLPPRSARMLSEIVAAHLLAELAARADLPPSLTEELRQRVAVRLPAGDREPATPHDMTTEEALTQARCLAAQGNLDEAKLLEAAQRGEIRFAASLLAVAAGLPVSVVDRASTLRSAKGMVSLVWKAGFTMRAAVALQTLLARLAPDEVLRPGPADQFPLAVEEMRWQLDFLARMGR
jgi:uncharacterized protein (DUF2336 family)